MAPAWSPSSDTAIYGDYNNENYKEKVHIACKSKQEVWFYEHSNDYTKVHFDSNKRIESSQAK